MESGNKGTTAQLGTVTDISFQHQKFRFKTQCLSHIVLHCDAQ